MGTKRILLIDDEETIQTVVQFGIKIAAGWDVLVANTGLEGIAIAQAEYPDAILLDVMMPDVDGIATLKVLQSQAKTQHIPVIFLTANAQTPENQQLYQLGASGAIRKPFNSLDLPKQIATILHWSLS